MKAETESKKTTKADPMESMFYAGSIKIDGVEYGLIVSPKETGEFKDKEWNGTYKNIKGATSYNDGLSNTIAMAKAGSDLAKAVINLRINDHADWYIPSQDELEIIYRNLKPSDDENYQWARSGINLSAIPPTRPYTENSPKQTEVNAFMLDESEAFNREWYWTSTQHAGSSSAAWCQYFGHGDQNYDSKSITLRCRAVRRFKL